MNEELIKDSIHHIFDFDLTDALPSILHDFFEEMLLLYQWNSPLEAWIDFCDEWLGVTDVDKVEMFIVDVKKYCH